MLYSVWNQGTSQFDYYETNKLQPTLNAEKPQHMTVQRTLGATPEQAAWPLPPDARPIGTGSEAIGRIAARKNASSLGDITGGGSSSLAILAAAGAIVYYVMKHRRRS